MRWLHNWPYLPLKGKYNRWAVGLRLGMCGGTGQVRLFTYKFIISREMIEWLRHKQKNQK